MHKIAIRSDIPCAGNICTYTCHAAARSFACVLCLCVHSANKVSSLKFHCLHALSPILNATCSRTIFLFLFMPHTFYDSVALIIFPLKAATKKLENVNIFRQCPLYTAHLLRIVFDMQRRRAHIK